MDERGFAAVVGHKDVIQHLKNASVYGRVSHAYLFSGEPGSGKKLLSSLFATLLECRKSSENPCFACESCRKAVNMNHPDIIYVHHEKPDVITVDEIRSQVVSTVGIRPYESEYKIYIIDEAEKMNPQAQNALLKTIEEPPVYAVIMLLSSNPDALLETIRSRCVRLNLRAVSDEEVLQYLQTDMQLPDYEAEIVRAFAQGNIGRARDAASGSALREISARVVALMKQLREMKTYEIGEIVKEMSENKKDIHSYLDMIELWFRDVLLYKATQDADSMVFRRELVEIRRESAESSYEGLDKILKAVERARTRLRANVNFDLTMELLFMTIAEHLS